MKNLDKYQKKKGMVPASPWKAQEAEGHDGISTNDFETVDTDNDPLEDKKEAQSSRAMKNLEKYERLKKK